MATIKFYVNGKPYIERRWNNVPAIGATFLCRLGGRARRAIVTYVVWGTNSPQEPQVDVMTELNDAIG